MFDRYVLISSSAVYPETNRPSFREDDPVGPNSIWKAYGTEKIAAEQALLARRSDALILCPPYLYGPMNNVYREAFVFDCAMADRPFCLPGEGLAESWQWYRENSGLVARKPLLELIDTNLR